MGSADTLRAYAADCVAKAQAAQNDDEKAAWLAMAQAWLRLAQDAARFRDSVASTLRTAGEAAHAVAQPE